MDPLSIAASSFSLAAGIVKASIALTEFSRDFSDAAEDLTRITNELQALSAVLDPISRILSQNRQTNLPTPFVQEVDDAIQNCQSVVEQVEDKVRKFQRNKAWTKVKWVAFGQSDIQKLQESLGFYKVALGIGLHAISIQTGYDIKDDTAAIRSHVDAVMLKTDMILAKVNSIPEGKFRSQRSETIEQWIDDIALLSSYAESSYMETVVDPTELRFTERPLSRGRAALGSISEADNDPPEIRETDAALAASSGTTEPILSTAIPPIVVPPSTAIPPSIGVPPRTAVSGPSIESPAPGQTEGSMPKPPKASTSPGATATSMSAQNKKFTIVSVDGLENLAEEIQAVASAALPDQQLIERSRARRKNVHPDELKRLDEELCHQSSGEDNPALLGELIGQGADPNYQDARALAMAITSGNSGNVCELLRGGARPNAHSEKHSLRLAAQCGQEVAVWALVAAGGNMNSRADEAFVPLALRCALLQTDPPKLLKDDLRKRIRILRFLLANGALLAFSQPFTNSDIFDKARKEVEFTLAITIRDWSMVDKSAAALVFSMLIEKLPRTLWSFAGIGNKGLTTQVAVSNNEKVLEVLGPYMREGASLDAWDGALKVAAMTGALGIVKILSKPPYAHPRSLLALTAAYFQGGWVFRLPGEPSPSDWTLLLIKIAGKEFQEAAQILLQHGADPNHKVSFHFRKKRLLGRGSDGFYDVSALQLVDQISTDRDRKAVKDLFLEHMQKRKQ